MTTTIPTPERIWSVICPSWCAALEPGVDHVDHPDLHQSLVTSVEVDGNRVHVNLEQQARSREPAHVAVYRGDDELFTAPAPAMRSLAAQLVAAADLLEGLPRRA